MIRIEAANSVAGRSMEERKNGDDVGVGDPELARALQQLSVEIPGDGGRCDASASSAEKAQADGNRGGTSPAVTATPPRGAKGGAREQGQLLVACEHPVDHDGGSRQGVRPMTGFSGGALEGWSFSPRSPQYSPPPSMGEVRRADPQVETVEAGPERKSAEAVVGKGNTMAAASEIREGEQGGDETVKSVLEKLLRTSSSVALAAAKPLSITPPLVLKVQEDPHQVT